MQNIQIDLEDALLCAEKTENGQGSKGDARHQFFVWDTMGEQSTGSTLFKDPSRCANYTKFVEVVYTSISGRWFVRPSP